MPNTMIAADAENKLHVAPGVSISVDDLTAMHAPANLNDTVTAKSIVLATARVETLQAVKGVPGDKHARYTIAVTVSREPVTEGERVAMEVKAAKQTAAKTDKEAKAQAAIDRVIATTNAHAAERIKDVKEMAQAGVTQTTHALGQAFSALVTTPKA